MIERRTAIAFGASVVDVVVVVGGSVVVVVLVVDVVVVGADATIDWAEEAPVHDAPARETRRKSAARRITTGEGTELFARL
ncbi:MAG TPA: hypothetical protein VMZ22_02375 [Acidimicrobiales bacterium]|nr:hypothetical protein [Acidimicrobiales bacterium]